MDLILWMDGQIIVCRKPAGVLAQGDGSAESMETLLSRQCGGSVYPVHRLDRQVGGVMVYARTSQAAASLSAQMQRGAFQKEYFAIAEGIVPPEGRWEDLLFRDSRRAKAFVVSRMRQGVKEARLSFCRLQTAQLGPAPVSLCRVRLETGRFHQIRVQFASRGFPLAGDGKYGGRISCPLGLFACHLQFSHPHTGKPMEFFQEPPETPPWDCFFYSKK